MRAIPSSLLALAALLETLYLSTHWLRPQRQNIAALIIVYLAASLVYLFSAWLVLRSGNSHGSSRLRRLVIVSCAVLFRLTAWPLDPALSDDVYRYRWEGKLQASGGNPYQARPNDREWAHLQDDTFPRVGNKDFKAGYGPLVELLQHGTYRAVSALTPDGFRQAFWFKLPCALLDLGVIAALCALLAVRGLPVERVLIYAWSPLPVMEFWATGHNDAAAVLFVLLALLAAAKERWTAAFVALSLAAVSKFWPLILFPAFIGWKGWRPLRWHQWWVLVPITGVLALPYWSDMTENARFMSGFLGGWRNNDSLYGLLLWATGDVYRAKYLAFAIVIAAAVLFTLLRWPLEKAALATLAVLLMVSANCHPWYLTWLLPLLAFHPVPGLLLWTAIAPLAHVVVIRWVASGEWQGLTPLRWWIYVPVYGALIVGWFLRRRRVTT
jgi:hypothetical protein